MARVRQALRLYRELGHRFQESEVLTHLGHTHHAAGENQEARDSWQRALTILDELAHPDAHRIRADLRRLDRLPQPSGRTSLTPHRTLGPEDLDSSSTAAAGG